MEELQNLFNLDFASIIMGLFIIILGIDKIVSLLKKVKSNLRIKLGYEEDKESIEDRISVLEKHDNWQYKEISKISQCVSDIDKRMLDKDIDDMRWELLDFCSALTGGREYNREAFDHIFRIYEKYERILKNNKMTNGFVDESMKYVKEVYHKNLENGNF